MRVLLGFLVAVAGGWCVLVLAISGPPMAWLRLALAAACGAVALFTLVAVARGRWGWRSAVVFGVLFAAVLAWYFSIAPSNQRDWVAENAVLPRATIEGDAVTVHNIRNFSYRTESDFTPAYYDRRFQLSQLEGVDVVSVYWMGPHIAHVFLSFAFAGGEQLAISIEARKEKGEGYSTVNGFFRQYELHYVVADERDVIGLRTNYRANPPEQVYIYRVQSNPQAAQRVFMKYIEQINALAERPAFYNSLTTNCTTSIWLNSHVNTEHVPFSWKILASGHVPEFLYEQGLLAHGGMPFEQLQQHALANDRAHAAGTAVADFSRRIRAAPPSSAAGTRTAP